jgi:hypothetical protein
MRSGSFSVDRVEAEDGRHDWDSWLAYGTVIEASPVETSCVRDD